MSGSKQNTSHTSAKLRVRAMQAITEAKRPLAASEIESSLRINDHHLFKEISAKCGDYLRVILSLTHSDVFSKYKPTKPIHGIDRRAIFFGLADGDYDPEQWKRVVSKSSNSMQSPDKESSPQEKPDLKVMIPTITSDEPEKEDMRSKEIVAFNSLFNSIAEDENVLSSWNFNFP